jgi:hypothetical protein
LSPGDPALKAGLRSRPPMPSGSLDRLGFLAPGDMRVQGWV